VLHQQLCGMNPNNVSGGYDSIDFDLIENYDLFIKNPFCCNFKILLDNRGNICKFYDKKSFQEKLNQQHSSMGAKKDFLCVNSNIQSTYIKQI